MPATKVALASLGPGESLYKMDSGRCIKVTVHLVANYDTPECKALSVYKHEENPEDYDLIFQAWLVNADGTAITAGVPTDVFKLNPDGSEYIDPKTGDPVVDHVDTTTNQAPVCFGKQPRHVYASAIANGQDSLGEHWKLWSNERIPTMNAVPPVGLAAGQGPVKDTSGNTWWCDKGHPDASPFDAQAAIGDYYQDAVTSLVYRARESMLDYYSRTEATKYDAHFAAKAEPVDLKLPTL